MDSLRIAICEDEDKDTEVLRSLIEESGAPVEITCFKSGGGFLASSPAGRYDLVFFDIFMNDITGIEAARVLRKSDENCGVVFTTSSEDYRSEAFDVGASQYLIKPVDREKLFQIIRKKTPDKRKKSCIINAKGSYISVPFDNIYYVEVKNHNCFVHTAAGVIETGSTMTIEEFRQILPAPRFMRCHKSFIVNLSYVESVDRDFTMKDGNIVYIRRGDVAKCKMYKRDLDIWLLDEAGKEED